MTYVVTELCVDCKYTDCAAVCPVEAFHELIYINPDTCIDLRRLRGRMPQSKQSSPSGPSPDIRSGRRSTPRPAEYPVISLKKGRPLRAGLCARPPQKELT